MKSIEIPLTEEELEDILHNDKEFDWEFDGVKVHLYKEEDSEDAE